MQNLKVTIIQSEIIWENPGLNFELFGEKINRIRQKTDLILLPEMFTSGFTMNAKKVADKPYGKTAEFLKYNSQKKKAHIAGSVVIKEKNKFYNRLILASPDGKIYHYDKRHLFRMGKEHSVYTAGNEHLIIKIKGWRVAFFICYDLRFPEWCRNKNNYDISVFVANWPEIRRYHWNTLLLARAIENQSYVIGANRVGKDGNGIKCSGESAIINPKGEYLLKAKNEDRVFTAGLSYKLLIDYRKKFPAYKDADKFVLERYNRKI